MSGTKPAPQMPVQFFSLTRQWAALKGDIMPALEELLDTQYCIGGKTVEKFETAFAATVGSTEAISCGSGTSALWLALAGLNLQKDEIVLTTPFSFIASSSEIVAHGGHPVFIDVNEVTHNIDPKKLLFWLTTQTEQRDGVTYEKTTGYKVAGILAVNIFGQCADFDAISDIADMYNLWTIEDAAQSVGATHHENQSGSLADVSCFSFYPTKNLGACGDAGIITTSNSQLAEKMRQLKNHGRSSHYAYERHGINSRLDAIQALILTKKLAHLAHYTSKRQSIAKRYTEAFKSHREIVTPETVSDNTHVYHQYVIQVDRNKRDQIQSDLEKLQIQTRIFYPEPLHAIPFLQTDERLSTPCPQAEKLCKQVLALPVWPELTHQEVEAVIDAVIKTVTDTKPDTSLKTPEESNPGRPA